MDALPEDDQSVAARMFFYLVTPNGTKISHTARDLADYTGLSLEQVKRVLARLSDRSHGILMTVSGSPTRSVQDRYQVVHDSLAPAVSDWAKRFRGGLEVSLPLPLAWLSPWIRRRKRPTVTRRQTLQITIGAGYVFFLIIVRITGMAFLTQAGYRQIADKRANELAKRHRDAMVADVSNRTSSDMVKKWATANNYVLLWDEIAKRSRGGQR
jgi:hypothetical protein